jgi:hypothetical protein
MCRASNFRWFFPRKVNVSKLSLIALRLILIHLTHSPSKVVNPDDANGAALEAALVEVADCKSFQGRSDTWELQRWAWNEYDPAFFHLSTAQHQNASELRPSSANSEGCVITPMPYAPFPPAAHSSFVRLRRDITSDSCVVAMIYRALHVHCRTISGNDEFFHNIDVKVSAHPRRCTTIFFIFC